MEVDSSVTTSAKPPPLNSDQLNYLIWRYLQEAGARNEHQPLWP